MTTVQPAIDQRVQIGSGRLPLAFGASIDTMVEAYDAAAIVRVLDYEDLSRTPDLEYVDPEAGEESPSGTDGPGADDPGYVPSLARFTLQIEQVIYGDVAQTDDSHAYLLQGGGYANSTAYEIEDEPLVEIGATYLVFFAKGPGETAYYSLSFGRFEIIDDHLVPTSPMESVGIVQRLRGMSVQEAIQQIGAAADAVRSE